MNFMDFNSTNYPHISALIPHSGKMILLEKVIYRDTERIDCLLTISAEDPFADEQGNVPAYIGLEYMSQAVAAHGSLDKVDEAERGKIGFFVGSRKVEMFVQEFYLQQELLISANLVLEQEGFGVFDCAVRNADEGELLMSGRLNFFQQENKDNIADL